MKLTFLGTRGEIDARTRRHRMHSSLLVSYRDASVMIDCGLDWLGSGNLNGRIPTRSCLAMRIRTTPGGLRDGADCPVHAPQKTWRTLKNCHIEDRYLIKERKRTEICGITFEAFPVEHSILAPTVGYRINAGRACVFYGPDLLFIHERTAALKDVQLYIGDGATLTRSFVHKRGDVLIGHATVRSQLGWCTKEGIPRAIITHCGSEIVAGNQRGLAAKLRGIGIECGLEAHIAHDGMELILR